MNAELLKEKRLEKYYSRQELGDMIGVSRQAYTKWEKGKAEPSTENVLKLSQILEVSVDELLDETRKYSYSPSIVKNKKRRNKMIRRTIGIIILCPIAILCIGLLIVSIQSRISLRRMCDKAFEQNVGYMNYEEVDFQSFSNYYDVEGICFYSDYTFFFYDTNGFVARKKVSDSWESGYTYNGRVSIHTMEYLNKKYLSFAISNYEMDGKPQCAELVWFYLSITNEANTKHNEEWVN